MQIFKILSSLFFYSPKPAKMSLRKAWDYAVAHNIWNKVLAWAIYTSLGGGVLFVYTHFNGKSFFGTIGDFLTFKLPLWVCLLSLVLVAAFFYLRTKKQRPGRIIQIPSITAAPSTLSIQPKHKGIKVLEDNLIVDSNYSDKSTWKGYGQRLWDNDKREFVGEIGTGECHFRQHALTIERTNTAGRYIIELKKYLTGPIDFIPQNLYGRNPRSFRVKFEARALSGGIHTIRVIFRKKDAFDWLDHLDFKVAAAEWEPQTESVNISCDQDFVINIDTFATLSGTRLMVKNFTVEEWPFAK